MALVAILEKRVGEHLAQRRRQPEGHPEVNALFDELLEDDEKRDVRLADCLEEPVLFEELRILGVPYERQVGVEYDR
jgi:hypothetical protein